MLLQCVGPPHVYNFLDELAIQDTRPVFQSAKVKRT